MRISVYAFFFLSISFNNVDHFFQIETIDKNTYVVVIFPGTYVVHTADLNQF